MTLGYGLRLILLAPACFFLIHLAVGLLVRMSTGVAIRHVGQMSASRAANVLLAARIAPSVVALAAVFGLCIPSFVVHEPRTAAEGIGVACLLAAAFGLVTWGNAVGRGARAIAQSSRFLRCALAAGRDTRLQDNAVCIVDHASGLVALAGVLRPRLLVSQDVLEALTPDEMQAALGHERAHCISRDNLKHLLILLTPSLLPGWRGFAGLDRVWRQCTEWAADDRATAVNPQCSVALAAALVRVSRLAAIARPAPLTASLLDGREHLESRVDRLLTGSTTAQPRPSKFPVWLALAAIITAVLPALRPGTLVAVHNLLENLIR